MNEFTTNLINPGYVDGFEIYSNGQKIFRRFTSDTIWEAIINIT